MAKENFTEAKESVIDGSHFEPYKWARKEVDDSDVMIPGSGYADLAGKANEISQGISVILEMIEVSGLERENDERPLLSPYAEGALLRLAIRSANTLAESAEEGMNWAYRFHTKEGRKEHGN